MAHTHPVIDDDKEFIIDPVSRVISHPAENQPILIQHDHNSERMTFKIPLSIDGHDLTKCNLIRVHFINISGVNTEETCASLYEVDDLKADPEDSTQAIFSWLIAQEATMYVGTLSFLVEFACVNTSTKIIDYSWHTGIYDGIIISNGMDNSEAVIGNRYDVLDTWLQQFKDELLRSANGASELVAAASVKAQGDFDTHAAMVKDQLAVDVLSTKGILTNDLGNSSKKIVSQFGVNKAINDVKASVDTVDDRLTKILNVVADKVYRIEGVFSDTITLGDQNKSDAYVDVGICIIGPAVRLEFGVNGEYMLDDTFETYQLPYGIKPHEPIAICVSSLSVEVSDNVYEYDNAYLTIDTNGLVNYSVTRESEEPGNVGLPNVARFMCHTEKSEYVGGLAELLDVSIPASSHSTYVKSMTGEEPEYSTAGDAVRAQVNTLWDYLDHYSISVNSRVETTEGAIDSLENTIKSLNDTTNDRIDKNSKRLTNIERSLNPESFEIDDTMAYIKDVPEDVLPRALINKVGGISRKCNNIIPYPYADKDYLSSNGVTITANKDGSITINGTPTDTVVFSLYTNRSNQNIINKEKTYTISLTGNPKPGSIYINNNVSADGTAWGSNLTNTQYKESSSFVVSEQYRGMQFYIVILSDAGELNNITVYPMINEGSTALPYEPFFSGLRDVKVTEVKSAPAGENKFNPEWLLVGDGVLLDNGYYAVRMQTLYSKYNIDAFPMRGFKENTQYSLSLYGYNDVKTETWVWQVYYTDGTKEEIGVLNSIGSPITKTATTAAGKTVSKIAFTYYNADTCYIKDICVREGVDATYVPYVERTLQIPESLTKTLDGYGMGVNSKYNNHIEWDADTGKATYHRCVRRVIFDGSEILHKNTGSTDCNYLYYSLVNSKTTTPADTPCVSTTKVISSGTPTDSNHGCAISTKYKCIYFNFGDIIEQYGGNDIDGMSAYLAALYAAGTPFVVDYVVEPEIIDISDKITPDNIIDVTGGGTITAVNEHNDPACVEMIYQFDIAGSTGGSSLPLYLGEYEVVE